MERQICKYCRGITLLELLIVVSILGIVAVAAVPSLSPGEPYRLELAAREFAQAMRYARSEAIRTGEPRGFHLQATDKRIRVIRPTTPTPPFTAVYDIYHPVSKQFYDIDLDTHPFAAAATTVRSGSFRTTCNKPDFIYFDPRGTAWCGDPANVMLNNAGITLGLGSHTRVVSLDGITGRVTVQ